MTNHLANENSPYLLQHAENPVEWYPWGEAALERAQQENKPIFLSIGYAACHWCHVMAHESFEDPDTAKIMNQHFINIKVDREERPDLDSIYMSATMALTRSGGWPMSVFLTPDLEPFFAGTYFPPVPRYQMPSFKDVLTSVASAWDTKREDLLHTADQVKDYLQRANQIGKADEFSMEQKDLNTIADDLLSSYDQNNGGWGSAPKFPQPMLIEILINRCLAMNEVASDEKRQKYKQTARHVLSAIAQGGMYDVVGGGFARYSVDAGWLVPHFEKMLYDNGQLALAYLHGYLVSGDEHFREVCAETLTFIERELTDPAGGFYSSLDADSEGVEGKYYIWDYEELEVILGDEFQFFNSAYDITPEGNWEGKIILQRIVTDEKLAQIYQTSQQDVKRRIEKCHRLLFKQRNLRIRPATDDKVLVSWNALALIAFVEAGRYLSRPDFIQIARKNANFLLKSMYQDGRLLRSWRDGVARHNAYLEDYAGMILGLLALYQSDPDPDWYKWALKLAEEMMTHFRDPAGGFFDTRDDHEQLVVRPKDTQDNATPSGNALAAHALLQISAFGDHPEWRTIAEKMLAQFQSNARQYPTAFGKWLQAIDFAVGSMREIAILGNPEDQATQAMVRTTWNIYNPYRVVAISNYPPHPESPTLVKERKLIDEKPTAYICQNFICKTPINDLQAYEKQLNRKE
jgi:hypothetical protein